MKEITKFKVEKKVKTKDNMNQKGETWSKGSNNVGHKKSIKDNILAGNISYNCCYFYLKILKERSYSQSETEISTSFINHFYLI